MIKRRYERGDIVAFRCVSAYNADLRCYNCPRSPTEHRSPQECGKLLVKRLIALPGDKVASLKPILTSPALSDTNQVKTLPPYPDTEVIIPEGHGWLEGDAPFNSEDSNHFGPVSLAFLHAWTLEPGNNFVFLNTHCGNQVPMALIDSKLACVLWPLDRVGAIDSHATGTQAERVQVVQLSRT